MNAVSILVVTIALFVQPVSASAETLAELQNTITSLKSERTKTEAEAKLLGEQFDASNNKEQKVAQLENMVTKLEGIKAGIERAELKIANGDYVSSKKKDDSNDVWYGLIGMVILGVALSFTKKKGASSSSDGTRYSESFYSQENSFQRNEQGDLGTRDSKGGFTRHGD